MGLLGQSSARALPAALNDTTTAVANIHVRGTTAQAGHRPAQSTSDTGRPNDFAALAFRRQSCASWLIGKRALVTVA